MVEVVELVELNESNFAEVLGRSDQLPILVDFYAEWCEPCKAMAPTLEKLAVEMQGRLIVAKVDADAQPALCQQFQVQSLPTLKLVVQRQLAAELVGAQTEGQLRDWLTPFLPAGEETLLLERLDEQLEQLRTEGQLAQAAPMLEQLVGQHPEQQTLPVKLATIYLDVGEVNKAKDLIAQMADELEGVKGLQCRIAFLEDAESFGEEDMLRKAYDLQPTAELCYQLAIMALTQGRAEQGLALLIESMVNERGYKEGLAQKALLSAFESLGKGHALVARYRRKLYNLLH